MASGMDEPPQTPSFQRGLASINTTPNAVAQIDIDYTVPAPTTQEVTDFQPYDVYKVYKRLVWDTGNVQMPGTGVGAAGTVAAVVKAHGGMLKLVTAWVVGRTGSPPVMPAFQTADTNLVPLTASIVAEEVVPSADGMDVVFLTAGVYEHAVLYPEAYEHVAAVPPQFADPVRAAALVGHTAWADLLAQTGGAANANPLFIGGFSTQNQSPAPPPGFDAPSLPSVPVTSQSLSPDGGSTSGGGYLRASVNA